MGDRIARAAARAGRDPAGVTLVAVTKTKPLEDALAAYAAGIRAFGENRVQEAEEKFPALPADAARHLIGPLQSNKANRAARVASVVQTVDSADIARRLSRAAVGAEKRLTVFLEVRLGGEATKAGVVPEEAAALAGEVRTLPGARSRGAHDDPAARRHPFALRDAPAPRGGDRAPGLSMGMSDDFEAAVEEGATHVRVGTAIFGRR